MVGVEDRPGRRRGRCVSSLRDAPRQLEDAVEPGADPALLGRLRARALQPVDLLGDEVARRVGCFERLQLGAVLADDVVVALAELLADRGELLAQQELALLLVDALGDVVADRLGDLQLGEVVAGPGQHELDALGDVDGGEHLAPALLVEVGPRHDAVGERAGLEPGAQQLGQAARPAQLGDLLEHDAQLAGERLDAGRRAGVAQDLGVGVRGAALGGVDGGDAGAGLDAHDGDGLAGRQRADVGHLGDDGELIVAGAEQHPAVGARPWRPRRRGAAWSVTRARVMTAPGRTVAGSSASGSRVLRWRCSGRSWIEGYRSIAVATQLDTGATQVCWVARCSAASCSASSQLTRVSRSLRYGITSRGTLTPSAPQQAAAAAVEGEEAVLVPVRRRRPRRRRRRRWRRAAEELDAVAAPGRSRRTAPARTPWRVPPAAVGQQVAGGDRALLGGVRPVLDAHLLAEQRVRPAGHVAGRVHARRAGGQRGVADDAVAELQPAALQPAGRRRHADADDDDVGGHDRAVGQRGRRRRAARRRRRRSGCRSRRRRGPRSPPRPSRRRARGSAAPAAPSSTVTAQPRARAVAATSRPMNPAPMTTTRAVPSAMRARSASESSSVRSSWTSPRRPDRAAAGSPSRWR